MSSLSRISGRLPEALQRRLSLQLTILGWLALVVLAGVLGIIAAPFIDRILVTALALGLVAVAIAAAVGFFRGD